MPEQKALKLLGYDETKSYLVSIDENTGEYVVQGTNMWTQIFWFGAGAFVTWMIMKGK